MSDVKRWKQQLSIFLVSQTLSLFGSSLVQYALMWYVTLETKSGIVMTVFVLCGFVPTFLMSPFAGVWADRMDRKKLIVISDFLIAVATLGLAAVFLSGEKALWLIMVTAAIRALGTAIQGPAVGAILPQFVPAEQLAKVNGIQTTIQSAIMFVSPVVSGFLLSVWPIEGILFIDVGTALIAILVLLLFVKIGPHKKASQEQTVTYLEDMKLGFKYIGQHKFLVSFFGFVAALLVLVAPAAFLTPLQVARNFGEDVWRLTAIEIVFSLGMMLGGGIIAAWGGFKNRMYTMIAASVIMGVCTILLSAMPNFWIYLIPMGVFGIAMPFYNTGATVLIQEHVEEQYLGRVFSVFTMLMTSMMPLGMLIFGPLAELVAIEYLLVVTGILILLSTVLVLANKSLIAHGIKPQEPAASAVES